MTHKQIVPSNIVLFLEEEVILFRDTTLVELRDVEPMRTALDEDGGQNRISMERFAFLGQFLQESGAPGSPGLVGTLEDMFVIFCGVLTKGAPVGVTWAILMDELAGGKHFMTELHKMSAT